MKIAKRADVIFRLKRGELKIEQVKERLAWENYTN